MVNLGGELVRLQQLQVQLRAFQSENEHLKSKAVDSTTIQTLQVQVTELKSEIEGLKLSVKELTKAHKLVEVTLRQRDEIVYAQFEKMRLLEEQTETFHEVQSEFDLDICHDTQDNSEKVYGDKESALFEKIDQMKSQVSELLVKLQILNQEMKQQIVIFEEDKQIFLAKNKFLEKMSSSTQNEYNDLLASNDVLKQRLETKFMFLIHDNYLEKMIEMIEKEYESNVSKIHITSSMSETNNLELVKKMGDKMKWFDEEKRCLRLRF
ncbi:hypothetical protein Tco_0521102 [Tanacetum coccineum]